MQGYFISQPLTADEMTAYLQDSSSRKSSS